MHPETVASVVALMRGNPDLPMGTAMSHLFRARAKLRAALSDYAREVGLRHGPGKEAP